MTDVLEEIPVAPRPPERTNVFYISVATKLMPHILAWLRQSDPVDEEEEYAILKDLVNAIEYSVSYDGYELAEKLRDWNPDAQLVDILDRTSFFVSDARMELTKQWVEYANIKPTYKIGDQVKVIAERRYNYEKGVEHVGEIVHIYENRAQYTVCIEALGHIGKRKTADGKQSTRTNGTIGNLVNYEDVRPVGDSTKVRL